MKHTHFILAFFAAFAIAGTDQTSADTHTWTGGNDGDWNDAGNWDIGIPVANDDLIFTGTSNTTTNNDLAVISIAGIQFNNTTAGQSFSLAGSDINLTGNITTAAVVGGGTIEDTISLRLRPTVGIRTINLGADHNLTISGEIFGPQAITKQGDGKLTLSAANTYYDADPTTVSSGILEVQNSLALGTAAGGTVVASGATLRLNNGVNIASEALTLSGTLDGRTNGGDVEYGGAITLAADAEFFAGGSGTFTVSGNVDGAGNRLTIQHGSPDINITGLISGTGTQVVKTGSGTSTLTAANTHTGGTGVREGTLIFTDQEALGTGTVSMGSVTTEQTLEFGATGMNLDNSFFIQNTNGANRTIRLDVAGTATGEISGNTDLRLSSAGIFRYDVGADDTLTNSGSIYNGAGGNAGITKEGTGTLRLTNATNTFKGKIVVNKGELQIAESGRINDQTIEIADGATFRWSSSAQADGGDAYFTGGITGDGTFIKDGSNSTFTTRFGTYDIANIKIHQGTMQGVGNINALGQGTTTVYLGDTSGSNNATMNYGGALSGTMTTKADIVVQAGSSGTKTYAKGNSNDMTDNTTITLNDDLTVSPNSAGTLTFGGVISGSGGLTKTNTGTLELSGDNTYTGATTVNAGLLVAGSTSAFGSNSATTVDSGAVLELDGNNNSIGSLAGAGTVENANASAVTLTTGGDNTSTTFSGVIQDGTGGGALSLTKTGTGTTTLTGTNTYKGATRVNAGTLLINGDNSGATGAITVANGATLGGSGILGTGIEGSGGTVAPGNSAGLLTTPFWDGTGMTFEWELEALHSGNAIQTGGSTFDQILLTPADGTLTLNSTTIELDFGAINLLDGSTASDVNDFFGQWSTKEWLLVGGVGTVVGSTSDVTLLISNQPNVGNALNVSNFYVTLNGGTNLILRYEALPEPTTFGLLGLFLGAITAFARPRRRLD